MQYYTFAKFVFADNARADPSITTSAFVGTNIETDLPFLGFRLLSMIQFDLTDLRGSCVTSTYSVEDGPKPVI